MTTITIPVSNSENFTPAGLMHRYAKENIGVEFQRTVYGEAKLSMNGVAYKYDHWKIGDGFVLLYLKEV